MSLLTDIQARAGPKQTPKGFIENRLPANVVYTDAKTDSPVYPLGFDWIASYYILMKDYTLISSE